MQRNPIKTDSVVTGGNLVKNMSETKSAQTKNSFNFTEEGTNRENILKNILSECMPREIATEIEEAKKKLQNENKPL